MAAEQPLIERSETRTKKRRGTRVAYAEAHKELKTRVGLAVQFLKGCDTEEPVVAKALIRRAIELLEGT